MFGSGSSISLILFLTTLGTVTADSWYWNDDVDGQHTTGQDRHYHCARTDQGCQNGGQCDEDTGKCVCNQGLYDYHYYYYSYDAERFHGYDCSINVTGYMVSYGCPCQNAYDCYIQEDSDTFICDCHPDYFGRECSENRVKANCDTVSIQVLFNPIQPFTGRAYLGEDPDDEACLLYRYWSSPETQDTYTYNLWVYYLYDQDKCNLKILNQTDGENTNTSYKYELTIQYDPIVQSHLDLVIDVTCHLYERDTWGTQSSVSASRSGVHKGRQIQDAIIPVEMKLLLYSSYDYPKDIVYLGQRMKLVNQLTGEKEFPVYTTLFVESCTFSDSVGDKKVTVIEDGCPTDRSGTLEMSNPTHYYTGTSFDFRVFRFGNDPVVKVACRVRLCKEDDASECEMPNCEERQKRDAGDDSGRKRRKRQTRGGEQGMISSTFTVLDPFDQSVQAFQVTADKCMSEPVIKSVGISLVIAIAVLLTVSILLAFNVCRITRRQKAQKLRAMTDKPARSFSDQAFEGTPTGDLKYERM